MYDAVVHFGIAYNYRLTYSFFELFKNSTERNRFQLTLKKKLFFVNKQFSLSVFFVINEKMKLHFDYTRKQFYTSNRKMRKGSDNEC